MSETFVNQVTLDCLLNKEIYRKHLQMQKAKQLDKKDKDFYRKRICNLFRDMTADKMPDDLLPEVKYAYDNFLHTTINYFKTIDENDLRQTEYKEYNDTQLQLPILVNDDSVCENNYSNLEIDKTLMRSIQIVLPTLDKYVKKTSNKKKDELILPKQKDIDLKNPELKYKGCKNKNIDNLYEDITKEQN